MQSSFQLIYEFVCYESCYKRKIKFDEICLVTNAFINLQYLPGISIPEISLLI